MTEMPNLYDGPHASIVGTTGSGKTTLAIEVFENAPGTAIYVDPSGDIPVAATTIDMSEGESLDPSIFAEDRRILIIPPDGTGTEDDMRFMRNLQSLLFALGDNIPNEDGKFFVFIDEAHEFARLHADPDNPVIRFGKRGRKKNVRLFLISQSPADLSKKAVKQTDLHVIFAMNDYETDYLKRYGFPAEEIREKVGRPGEHRFVVWDGFDLHGPFKLDI